MPAEHLVIVGKSGVGTSTTAVNLAAALAEAGKKVALIGYGAFWNSTTTLRGSGQLSPLPGWHGEGAPHYAYGYLDTLCIEAGEFPGEAEKGNSSDLLAHPVMAGHGSEYVLHDVSWNPEVDLRYAATEGVPRLLVVTSADLAAIQVANELFNWLNTVPAANYRFNGVVINNLPGPLYKSMISDFVSQTGTSIAASVSHSLMVSVSDIYKKSLIESAPLSHLSYAYRKLAGSVVDAAESRRPKFLSQGTLQDWALKWSEIISELETGMVRDGSSI